MGRIGKRDDGKGQRGRGTDRQREGKEKEQTERRKKGRIVGQCETNNEVGMSKSHQSKPSIKGKGGAGLCTNSSRRSVYCRTIFKLQGNLLQLSTS